MKYLKLGRLSAVCALLLSLMVLPAMAENGEVQLAQLFGGNDETDSTVRVERMEQQIREFNGQIEELSFQLRQLQDQIRQLEQDIEYRLQILESVSGISTAHNFPLTSNNGLNSADNIEPSSGISPGSSSGTLGQLRIDPEVLGQISANTGATASGAVSQPLDLGAISGTGTDSQGGNLQSEELPVSNIDTSLDSNTLYDNAYSNLLAGNFSAASEQFEYFVENNPNDPLTADAQFWLGDSYFAQQQYRDAAGAYLKNYTDHPNNERVSESLLKLGLSLRGMGEIETACATFTELIAKYPEAPDTVKDKARAELERVECS